MCTTQTVKIAIEKLIDDDGPISFVEVAALPDAEGDEYLLAGRNIVLWSGLSKAAVDALRQLETEGRIQIASTSPLTYVAHGEILPFPLVQTRLRRKGYARPRWCPAIVRAGPQWGHSISYPSQASA